MQFLIASLILFSLLGLFYVIILDTQEEEEIKHWAQRDCVERALAATKICPP